MSKPTERGQCYVVNLAARDEANQNTNVQVQYPSEYLTINYFCRLFCLLKTEWLVAATDMCKADDGLRARHQPASIRHAIHRPASLPGKLWLLGTTESTRVISSA